MSLNPAAIAAARRNVAHRIERFLALLERDGRALGARQRFHLCKALEKLAAGQYPQAEKALPPVMDRPSGTCARSSTASWRHWAERHLCPSAGRCAPVHTFRFNAELAAERRLLKNLGEALRLRHSSE